MKRNANVGTKLLALIAVPAAVLVAVASLGASQRLDEASEAQQTETGARLAASSTDLIHELQIERLLTMRLAEGDGDVAGALEEQRASTDEVAETFTQPQDAVGDASVAQRYDAVIGQIQTIAELRGPIDEGSAAPEVALDAYTTAIDSVLELNASLVSRSGLPELSTTLSDTLTLSRAKEARALRSARIAAIAVDGAFVNGQYEGLAALQAEEERQFSGLEESQDGDMTTSVRNTMAETAVRDGDALMESVMDEAVIGGSGRPGVDADTWQSSAVGWLDGVQEAVTASLNSTITAADTKAFEASKSARLYLIGTAAAVILSILLASLLARRINRRLRRLTVAANQLATVELPRLVEDLRSPGDQKVVTEPIAPIEVDSDDEIGQLAQAFNAIQEVTSQVAEEQAALLRRGIADIFVNLARRNQSLLDRQIEFIDGLEAQEQDPDQLENLFKLDHLATRMRRNAESLLVLAGAEPPRRRARPVELADVVRVAIGEVEDFTRISLLSLDETTVGGNAAVDLAHLLSELMENATQFSPPDSNVEVVGSRSPEGDYQVTIADRGIGMSAEQLSEANTLLTSPPPVGLALSRSLGFIVVGRLARRLRVNVRLSAAPAGGITAVIDLPAAVLSGDAEAALAPPVDPAANGFVPAAPLVDEPLVAEPHPLLGHAPFSAPAADGMFPDNGFPLPEPTPLVDAPATLSDAIPAGDDFERGLASLVGPGPAQAVDDDVNRDFWGALADPPADDAFADLAAAPTDEDFQSLPPPPPPPDAGPPAWEPAPDWLDGELASVETSTPTSAMAPPPPPPAPQAAPVAANGGSAPLTRRTPKATLADASTGSNGGGPSGPRAASTRRSPEEVRAMLSRYRRGIEDGRQAPGTED